MLLGVNVISPQGLIISRRIIGEGIAQFCELMVDNFVHLSASEIKRVLPNIPIALHIVNSRILEKPENQIKDLGIYLRDWIAELQPLYVSDHLILTEENGVRLPFVHEPEYEKDFSHIQQRVHMWQDLLNVPILFENHASVTKRGKCQPQFYQQLIATTDCNLLFDISNAYIAEQNHIAKLAEWQKLIDHCAHFHIGSFKRDTHTNLLLDTHDQLLDDNVLEMIKLFTSLETLTVECDSNITEKKWRDELNRIISLRS